MAEDTEREETDENGGDATETATDAARDAPKQGREAVAGAAERMKGALGGGDGIPNKVLVPAAIAAAAAAGYAATKGAPKLKSSVTSTATSKAEDAAQGALSQAEDQGGVTGLAAKMFKGKAGGDGGGDGGGGMLSTVASKVTGGGDKSPSQGWGKGRRNPIQRWVDVAVPLETAYNQWTQFEEFPKFMHRVVNVNQDDEDRAKLKWQEKIWFSKRDWEAEITEQVPDSRIAWRTVSGTSHVGHVTFHRLDDELTRVTVNIDFNPSGMMEKMASGLRFVKRAAESDLCRFKAFIEAHGEATGAWRGRIEDGEVVEDADVEEGKPIEEGEDLRKPEGRASGEKEQEGDEGEDSAQQEERDEPQAGEEAAPEASEGEDEEGEAEERRRREQRREERRAAGVS
jgi:uncharacterized membrane protein